MNTRPNFYEILDLDPSNTSWSTIEPIIKKKKDEWNRHRNQGSPAQKRKAEQYLTYIKDIETLFKDKKATEDESKEYKRLIKNKQKEQLSQLDELINKSLTFLKQALETMEKLDDKLGVAYSLSNIGVSPGYLM